MLEVYIGLLQHVRSDTRVGLNLAGKKDIKRLFLRLRQFIERRQEKYKQRNTIHSVLIRFERGFPLHLYTNRKFCSGNENYFRPSFLFLTQIKDVDARVMTLPHYAGEI